MEVNANSCGSHCVCGAPVRCVWPPNRGPVLPKLKQEGWFILDTCPNCGVFWVEAVYEPYASFRYLIRWPHSADQWTRVAKLESGLLLSRWCDYEIRRAWKQMSDDDRSAVQHHRQRSIGRNPVDEPPAGPDVNPLEAHILV